MHSMPVYKKGKDMKKKIADSNRGHGGLGN